MKSLIAVDIREYIRLKTIEHNFNNMQHNTTRKRSAEDTPDQVGGGAREELCHVVAKTIKRCLADATISTKLEPITGPAKAGTVQVKFLDPPQATPEHTVNMAPPIPPTAPVTPLEVEPEQPSSRKLKGSKDWYYIGD